MIVECAVLPIAKCTLHTLTNRKSKQIDRRQAIFLWVSVLPFEAIDSNSANRFCNVLTDWYLWRWSTLLRWIKLIEANCIESTEWITLNYDPMSKQTQAYTVDFLRNARHLHSFLLMNCIERWRSIEYILK